MGKIRTQLRFLKFGFCRALWNKTPHLSDATVTAQSKTPRDVGILSWSSRNLCHDPHLPRP